jgi:hypothetical protein
MCTRMGVYVQEIKKNVKKKGAMGSTNCFETSAHTRRYLCGTVTHIM